MCEMPEPGANELLPNCPTSKARIPIPVRLSSNVFSTSVTVLDLP